MTHVKTLTEWETACEFYTQILNKVYVLIRIRWTFLEAVNPKHGDGTPTQKPGYDIRIKVGGW